MTTTPKKRRNYTTRKVLMDKARELARQNQVIERVRHHPSEEARTLKASNGALEQENHCLEDAIIKLKRLDETMTQQLTILEQRIFDLTNERDTFIHRAIQAEGKQATAEGKQATAEGRVADLARTLGYTVDIIEDLTASN